MLDYNETLNLVRKEIIHLSGKEQYEYFLNKPENFPYNDYSRLQYIGFENLYTYILETPLSEMSLEKINEKNIGLYHIIFLRLKPKEILELWKKQNISNIETITENELFTKWLSSQNVYLSLEIIENYAKSSDGTWWFIEKISENPLFSTGEIVLLINKYLRDPMTKGWVVNHMLKKRNISLKEAIPIFLKFDAQTRECILHDDGETETTIFTKLLIEDK